MGEPVRLMVDMPNEADLVALFIHRPGEKVLVASSAGDGFIVPEADVIAQTRSGRQVLNVKDDHAPSPACRCPATIVAVVGKNRKLLVFPLMDLPEMTRGKGVRLQAYRDKGHVLSDIKCHLDRAWAELEGVRRTNADRNARKA